LLMDPSDWSSADCFMSKPSYEAQTAITCFSAALSARKADRRHASLYETARRVFANFQYPAKEKKN
jgi:hypothetical protein